jgi:PAS domain S-box-containing protein
VEGRPHKHLVLVLARELVSQLVTPAFLVDAAGEVVYFNEAAEELVGYTFAEAGVLPAEAWTSLVRAEDSEGGSLTLEQLPAGIALAERRPAQRTLCITSSDGERRLISVTAVPLFASDGELVGVLAVFWRDPATQA